MTTTKDIIKAIFKVESQEEIKAIFDAGKERYRQLDSIQVLDYKPGQKVWFLYGDMEYRARVERIARTTIHIQVIDKDWPELKSKRWRVSPSHISKKGFQNGKE